jgi:hypothetical protein
MRAKTVGRTLAGLACAAVIGAVLTGCVIIPPPLPPIPRADGRTPSNPLAPPKATQLAADPISVTLRGGVPVVRVCEAATVDWIGLNESLLTDDPSKGYVDVWVASGNAHLAKGAEFAVGTAPAGLKPTVSGTQTFDFVDDYWDLTLDDFSSNSKTIEQKFRGRDLIEGIWLDYKGRAATGPCELAG